MMGWCDEWLERQWVVEVGFAEDELERGPEQRLDDWW